VIEVLTVTPRCAVRVLVQAHGDLAADENVLRGVAAGNRIAMGTGRFACVSLRACHSRGVVSRR